MQNPTVSVVVITYKQETMVAETLASIIAQTHAPDEIILADDASPDATVAVATKILKASGIPHKIITTDKNTGITANCNRGFAAASGDLIALIAGDDLMLRNRLAAQRQAFIQNPAAALCHTNMEWFDDATGAKLRVHHPAGQHAYLTSLSKLVEYNYVGGPSIMVRRSGLPTPAFNPQLPMVSDWLFNLELAARGPILYLPESHTRYRVHANNVSRRDLSKEELKTIEIFTTNHSGHHCAANRALSRIHRARATSLLLNGQPRTALAHAIKSIRHNPCSLLPYALMAASFGAWLEYPLPFQPVAKALNYIKQRRNLSF